MYNPLVPDGPIPSATGYETASKRVAVSFVVMGETFLIFWFFKWLLHANAKIFLLLYPLGSYFVD
jgi:hypothetical protein